MNRFVTQIFINFSIITQPSQMTQLPRALQFQGLMVFTRRHELNEVRVSSQLEDINFPLWDVVVVTC